MKTTERRGLTLIETVAAAALLAALAAASVPLLRDATRLAADPPRQLEVAQLSLLADAVIAAPARFGLGVWPPEVGALVFLGLEDAGIASPTGPITLMRRHGPPPIDMPSASATERGVVHAWLIFQQGDAVVCRWARFPSDQAGVEERR